MQEFRRCRGTWVYCDGNCHNCETYVTTTVTSTYAKAKWVWGIDVRCSNCNYKGPGKNEVGFLNNPKYLLFDFEGEKEIKTLDDSIDISNYSLAKDGKTKYNLLSFIANENDKFRAFIKNDKGEWCAFNEENAKEDVLIVKCSVIPHLSYIAR